MFCLFPERTVEFVNRVKVPVMGLKFLAAGAMEPKMVLNGLLRTALTLSA